MNEMQKIHGKNIYVDLTTIRISRQKLDESDNIVIPVFIDAYSEPNFLAQQYSKLEHLLGIFWMLKNLRYYDDSIASQKRKTREIEECEDEIRLLGERFNEPYTHQ